MPAISNPTIASFYSGPNPYSNRSGGSLGRLRTRVGRLGSITSASVTNSPTTTTNTSIPTAGDSSSLQTTANSIASIGNTAASLAKAALQAEAAQNAINAEKNLTAALTPGVITIIIGVIAYAVLAKK